MTVPQGGREKIQPLNHIMQELRDMLLVPTKNVQSLNRTKQHGISGPAHAEFVPFVWLYEKLDLKVVGRISEDMFTCKNNETPIRPKKTIADLESRRRDTASQRSFKIQSWCLNTTQSSI